MGKTTWNFFKWKTPLIFSNGRQTLFFFVNEDGLNLVLQMENYLDFLVNGRQPQFFFHIEDNLNMFLNWRQPKKNFKKFM